MSHTIHIKPCKIKLCIESHSTGLCVGYEIQGATHTAVPIRIYVSLLTPMADNRPVGLGCVTTSSIPIDRQHSLNDSHVQLITSTVHIANPINDDKSHLPPPHI